MKKVLIISPHFPPSNLAAVHRSRLFVQHLPAFGWQPTILTVHEKFYEENLDWNLYQLLSSSLKIEKVNAFKVTQPRLIGDIGLRAFWQLTKKAISLVKKDHFDFLYIPIPSFYAALIGRIVHERTGIKYGIDYIDPWVHHFPGSKTIFSRHWFSTLFARFLEPIAVKKVTLITGVAEGYSTPVLERNSHLKKKCLTGVMPYGGEEIDHKKVKELELRPYLFQKNENKIQLVYAGAMLPKAYQPLEQIFKSIRDHFSFFKNVEFHFIGTGKSPNDSNGYNIKSLAQQYGLWESTVFEYPARIPYLDVLVHLKIASGIFILGSTEPHYTPSKIYQSVLSGKPLLAILHTSSTAVKILQQSNAGITLSFNGEKEVSSIYKNFLDFFIKWETFYEKFDKVQIDQTVFEQYSAKATTQKLVELLNKCVPS